MFEMPTGRLDGMISSADSANRDLVSTKSSASELTQKFSAQGLGQDEMITLSGENNLAHFSHSRSKLIPVIRVARPGFKPVQFKLFDTERI